MEAIEMSFLFLGNRLCLDFINTEIVASGQRTSLIQSFEDLSAWLIEAGVASQEEIKESTVSWSVDQKDGLVREALALRDHLRRMALQVTTHEAVSDPVIAAINESLQQRQGYQVLSRVGTGYTVITHYNESASGLLTPIAASAADLLAQSDLRHLHKCENPQCILYFYDTSKNHVRRWCSMGACGNRSKAAAHYRKSRSQSGGAPSTVL